MSSIAIEAIKIVERASTINERRGGRFRITPDKDLAASRMQAWCQLVANGDEEKFAKRLRWDDLDSDGVRSTFGIPELKDKSDLPSWADLLTEAMETAREHSELSKDRFQGETHRSAASSRALPFEELFAPFVRAASRRLRDRVDSIGDLMGEAAYGALERSLAETLSFHLAPAIYTVFSALRATRQSSFDRMLSQFSTPASRELYEEFIASLLSERFVPLFEQYPVLARIIATVSNNWIEASGQFIDQLRADLPDLERAFNRGEKLGRVAKIDANLSDRHAGSKTVMSLSFEASVRLVYKPKKLNAEVAFHDLLKWLNENGAPFKLASYEVLSRPTHGWTQFIEHKLCEDEQELGRFYQHTGALLCLIYTLCGTDAHCENLIASGEYPMLVDMETLVHPPAPYEMEQPADIAVRPLSRLRMVGTVLRTGILPNWEFGPEGQPYDSSALWRVNNQETVVGVPRFSNVNTDLMSLSRQPVPVHSETHLPLRSETEFSLSDIADYVLAGFSGMYRFLSEHKPDLLSAEGPLSAFSNIDSRFLRRMTRFYMHHLFNCLQAHHLRDGADFSIQLDVLSREMISSAERPAFWSLLRTEEESLLQLDIPYFLSDAESGSVSTPGHETDDRYQTEPGFDLVKKRVEALSEADLAEQQSLIRASLTFRSRHVAHTAECGHPAREAAKLCDRARSFAFEIAQSFLERAVRIAEGGITWIGPESRYGGERHLFLPLGYGLYEGAAGVALFLSAAARISGNPDIREAALSSLRPLRSRLRSGDFAAQIADAIGIGGLAGCGSVVYSFAHCGELLDEPALFADALRVAELISPERIASDRNYDLSDGVAGALLALLKVYRISKNPLHLQRAIDCGRHLLKGRVANNGGPQAWRTGRAVIMTGFSHGAAGIAYALLRLYEASGETAFCLAAAEAIRYEATQFSAEAGNWRDLRPTPGNDDVPRFMTSWCNGAPGIALARLAGLHVLDGDNVRADIDRAISTTMRFGVGNLDHLCCGNFGRVAVLQTAASLLSRPELQTDAERQSEEILERAERTGSFGLSTVLPDGLFAPGLFQGLSGIGYALLQLAHPDELPSVLLLE
jgi:class II lanthipeptide synthase